MASLQTLVLALLASYTFSFVTASTHACCVMHKAQFGSLMSVVTYCALQRAHGLHPINSANEAQSIAKCFKAMYVSIGETLLL